MDLISRKDAVSRISDLLIRELKGKRIPTWNEVYNAIGDIPSVPAVPVDKLCEMLDKYNVTVPCNDDCEGCEAFDGTGDTVMCWKVTLAKWMEEQHD